MNVLVPLPPSERAPAPVLNTPPEPPTTESMASAPDVLCWWIMRLDAPAVSVAPVIVLVFVPTPEATSRPPEEIVSVEAAEPVTV